MAPVETPGACDGPRLQNPTDVLAGLGLQQQTEVVAHQAETLESKGVALLSLRQGFQERGKVGGAGEHRLRIVTAVERVVDQAVSDQPWRSSHGGSLTATGCLGKGQIELTLFSLFLVGDPARRIKRYTLGGFDH
jgi:hypothetical protein